MVELIIFQPMRILTRRAVLCLLGSLSGLAPHMIAMTSTAAEPPIRVLILDGYSNSREKILSSLRYRIAESK